jgi:hypothetical protein
MLSLKMKTYALLHYDDSVELKGSSLRSRKIERCFRRFINDAARGFMNDARDAVRENYFDLAGHIQQRTLGIDQISQWTMINQSTLESQPRLKRLVDRLRLNPRAGERIEVYERQDGQLALVSEYASDENLIYLLRRLQESAARFGDLFPTETDFEQFFPRLSPVTDLAAARTQESSSQLSLF